MKTSGCSRAPLSCCSTIRPASLAPRVLEGRHRLDGLLRCAGEYKLAVRLSELIDRNGDVVLGDAEEAAGADDRIRDRLVRRDDDVVDGPDLLVLVVEDWPAEHLPLRAPACRDFPDFCDAENRRPRNLGLCKTRRHQSQGCGNQNIRTSHDTLL